MSTPRLLVVEHEAACPPAWMGAWWAEAGVALDVRRPYAGDALPEDLFGHAGLVVLGGSMGAGDDAAHPWLTEVKALVRLAADREVPTLGICLGHQLCAVALGGSVRRNPRGQQVGVLDVGWTEEAARDPLLGPLARPGTRAVQWNDDIVERLPEGAVLLAGTGRGEVQAARFAPTVWGVQWHPEAGAEVIRVWSEEDRDRAVERDVDLEGYLHDVAAAEPELRATWRPLAAGFAALAASAAAALPLSRP